MDKKVSLALVIIILITIFNLSLVYFVFKYQRLPSPQFPNINLPVIMGTEDQGVEKFTSEDDMKEYLAQAESALTYGFGGGVDIMAPMPTMDREFDMGIGIAEETSLAAPKSEIPGRISETNVQVMGIDEPDIVKTDGQEIYFSSPAFYYETRAVEEKIMVESAPMVEPGFVPPPIRPIPPPRSYGATKAIKAFPPAELGIDADIDDQGEMLLNDDILVIFSGNEINGYDVSDPSAPKEKWTLKYEDRNWLETARLYEDQIYLITRTQMNYPSPCPLRPLSFNGQQIEIACTDIYHPRIAIPTDSTYSVMVLDPQNGQIKDKVAFVGTTGQSVIYMSANSIYVTYSYSGDIIKYVLNFFQENTDLIPDWVISRLSKLQSYDISDNAKLSEFRYIMEQFMVSLSQDDALKFENEMANRIEDYASKHNRELELTGIAKIDIGQLNVTASGSVPGSPINQFALDEYQDHLRIATTVGANFYMPMIGSSGKSANDVYVLDKDLKISGSVIDLGLTERIYSARFIEDKGYLVTFRQIDPFYVLDLSNPKKPELKGELKIPGYSSYLHPITKDKILGIGKEENQVKISLFDVADPKNPAELAKYTLDEYWSDILNTHHAFLLDDKHEIFFLPGSRGGYVFSYKNNDLKLEKAISEIQARRAIYLDDYLYIIGDNEIVILNELDWKEVNNLEF